MGLILALDVLEDVSFALIEPVVLTTLTSAVSPGPSQAAQVGSMVGLYPGAVVLINRGAPNQEMITVTAAGIGTITAAFAFPHVAGELVSGATFSSGQPDHPLFTLPEMLAYLLDIENDFLLKTRSIYSTTNQTGGISIENNVRFYPRPADAIRIERMSTSDGSALKNTSQGNQDIYDYGWEPQTTSDLSELRWFEDRVGGSQFGISPLSTVGGLLNAWYSQKDTSQSLIISSPLLVPDVCAHYMKYGVLARAWSKDGEQRDDFRAKYAQKRFDLGVKLVRHFMKGVEVLLGEEQEQDIEFQRLAVPAS